MFASNHHRSRGQSRGKKLWSNSGVLKCIRDLNHAPDVSAKKKKEREMSTRLDK